MVQLKQQRQLFNAELEQNRTQPNTKCCHSISAVHSSGHANPHPPPPRRTLLAHCKVDGVHLGQRVVTSDVSAPQQVACRGAQTANTSDTYTPRASAAAAAPCCGHTASPRPSALPAAGPQSHTCVAVERAVWGWVAHEGQHSLAQAQQRPGWAPGRLQDVQADLTRLHGSTTTTTSSNNNNKNSSSGNNNNSRSSSTSTVRASLPSSCPQTRHIPHAPGVTQRHQALPNEDCFACCGNPTVNTLHSGLRPDKPPLLMDFAASQAACVVVCALFQWARQLTLKCTLGWKILVLNRTVGGTRGYCSGTLMDSSKEPPSKGVSVGPCAVGNQALKGARTWAAPSADDPCPAACSCERPPGAHAAVWARPDAVLTEHTPSAAPSTGRGWPRWG